MTLTDGRWRDFKGTSYLDLGGGYKLAVMRSERGGWVVDLFEGGNCSRQYLRLPGTWPAMTRETARARADVWVETCFEAHRASRESTRGRAAATRPPDHPHWWRPAVEPEVLSQRSHDGDDTAESVLWDMAGGVEVAPINVRRALGPRTPADGECFVLGRKGSGLYVLRRVRSGPAAFRAWAVRSYLRLDGEAKEALVCLRDKSTLAVTQCSRGREDAFDCEEAPLRGPSRSKISAPNATRNSAEPTVSLSSVYAEDDTWGSDDEWDDSMAWTEPKHSREQVNRAGQVLAANGPVTTEAFAQAVDVLNNWRSAHAFPLNHFQVALRRVAPKYCSDALVAQRLKRAQSILGKLQRMPAMKLSRMQDLGGCRVVVDSVVQCNQIRKHCVQSLTGHEVVREDDYIATPKDSGYRGIHVVYKYRSTKLNTKRFDGLLVEMQIRSKLQHAWATAVETVDIITEQALKTGGGRSDWSRFFLLASAAFAEVEGTPLPSGGPPTLDELRSDLRKEASTLRVFGILKSFSIAVATVLRPNFSGMGFYLLVLSRDASMVTVWGFPKTGQIRAQQAYNDSERQYPNANVVLVSAASIDALRRAYPNYFGDTAAFIGALEGFIGS